MILTSPHHWHSRSCSSQSLMECRGALILCRSICDLCWSRLHHFSPIGPIFRPRTLRKSVFRCGGGGLGATKQRTSVNRPIFHILFDGLQASPVVPVPENGSVTQASKILSGIVTSTQRQSPPCNVALPSANVSVRKVIPDRPPDTHEHVEWRGQRRHRLQLGCQDRRQSIPLSC